MLQRDSKTIYLHIPSGETCSVILQTHVKLQNTGKKHSLCESTVYSLGIKIRINKVWRQQDTFVQIIFNYQVS